MKLPSLPIEGGCRCDRVRFRISAPPLLALACHCRGCQRMSASAYSLSLAIPAGGFALIAGETVIGGLHTDGLPHHHCDWCKSWLFTDLAAAMGFVNVRATMLDDASWYAPFVETCTDEALPWAATGARHSYPAFPPLDAFDALIADYREAVIA
jgi:hypothetical protein